MPGSVVAALREHKLRTPPAYLGDDKLVFVTRTGAPLDRRNIDRRGFARAYEKAGLTGRRPNFHELRHGHAGAWIGAGGDLVETSARLGHSSPAITAAIYSHEFEAARRSPERRARLDALYGADTGASLEVVPEQEVYGENPEA